MMNAVTYVISLSPDPTISGAAGAWLARCVIRGPTRANLATAQNGGRARDNGQPAATYAPPSGVRSVRPGRGAAIRHFITA